MLLRCFFFSKNSRNVGTFSVYNFLAQKSSHVNFLTNFKSGPTKFHWPRSKIKGTLFIVCIFKVHDLLDCVELENIHKLWKLSPPQAQHLPSLQADSLNRGWRVSKSRHQDLLTKLENPHETRGGAKREWREPTCITRRNFKSALPYLTRTLNGERS